MSAEHGKALPASRKRTLIGELLAEGLTQAEVARQLGLSKPTISYHARRLGIPARDDCRRRYDWSEIQRVYDSGLTVRQCAQRFGFALCSWHAAVKRGVIKPKPTRIPIGELLVVGRRLGRISRGDFWMKVSRPTAVSCAA
jgi:IS30 family transposase